MRDNFIMECLKKYPNACLLAGIGSAYLLYYVFHVVKRPVIACDARFKAFLLRHCPPLQQRFWPTFWCIETRMQTIVRSLLKSAPSVPYQKEFLETPDGGHIAVDWLENDESPYDRNTRPTVIILPGLTGSSKETYALHFALQLKMMGYRCAVFNYRGFGGADLKTARTYNAVNTEDLTLVITYVHEKYPQAPVMAVGISLGGLILTNHLAKTGAECGLEAAMTVSSPWNVFDSTDTLEEPVNNLTFNKHLTTNLKGTVKRHEHIFKDHFDVENIYKCKTIREFDDCFTSKQFGYPSYKEYYEDASIHDKIHHIEVPLLCLNAADDPFSPEKAIPLEDAASSKHVAIAMTSHGGHIGFLEGIFPRHTSYMDRVFASYADAIFRHGSELKQS